DHDERFASPHCERLALVERMLDVRRAVVDRIGAIGNGGRWQTDGRRLSVRWTIADPADPFADGQARAAVPRALALHVNFGGDESLVDVGASFEALFTHAATPRDGSDTWVLASGGVLYGRDAENG